MKKLQEKINKTAKAFVSNMLMKDAEEWPPSCMILAYQPMRPVQPMDNAEGHENEPDATIFRK